MIYKQILPFPASGTLPAFRRVKINSSGKAALAGAEPFIGTNTAPRDEAEVGRDQANVQPIADGIHYATVGNDTAIAEGGQIEASADGKVVAKTTGAAIGVCLEEVASNSVDGQVRVVYYPHANPLNTRNVVASGVHTWAGGAATTDSIAVTGLESGDVVLCTLAARASTETLAMAVNDHANDQIDLTLSANGTNGTTKISYVVLR